MSRSISHAGAIATALWGDNGHQIHQALSAYPRLRLVAYGAFGDTDTRTLRQRYPEARHGSCFEDILAVPGLALVSLCSPRRREQAAQTVRALQAGIHVYAEKPCAGGEDELDRLLAAAAESRAIFHEMAGTVCAQPYWAMRELVRQGTIGTVVQVIAQKSYPFHEGRPLREAVDGGLVAQNGVHAMRFVEHVTGLRAATIAARSTPLGEERPDSDLQMAAVISGALDNGGLFCIAANYLNPRGFGRWGNEMLRIFGTRGMVEATDGGTRWRLIVGAEDRGAFDATGPAPDWLACVIAHIADGQPMPFDLATELHPTRMVLRAKADAHKRLSAAPGVV